MCRVVNKRTHSPTSEDVYIGRPSKWGNPFVIGRDGTRSQVIHQYEMWLADMIVKEHITANDLRALRGKNLVCWCAPQQCHGHIIARYVAAL